MNIVRDRHEYQGLSTEDKPLIAPDGATYHSIDTGEMWVMNAGMWSIDLRGNSPVQVTITH